MSKSKRLLILLAAFGYFFYYAAGPKGGPAWLGSSGRSLTEIFDASPEMPHNELERVTVGSVSVEHTTVVSAYFDLSNNSSKSHPNWQFLVWLGKFLRSCQAPLIMFTDARTKLIIEETRMKAAHKTIILVYDDIWSLMRELEQRRNHSYRFNYEHVQVNYSLPRLYAIWNLKAYMLQRGVEMNPYNSQFFIYNDAGAWRDWETREWPDNSFIRDQVVPRIGDRMLLGQLRSHVTGYHCWHFVIEGGFFAGTAQAVTQFFTNYYRIHDTMLTKKEPAENYVGEFGSIF